MEARIRKRMLEEMEIRSLRPNTFRSYFDSMERFCKFFAGRNIDELGIDDLKRYQHELITKNDYAPNSINKLMSGVKFYYRNVLNRAGYTELLPRIQVKRKIPTILSESEVEALIDGVHNVKYKAIIMVMYSAGLRNSEVRNLKVDDIDSKRMVINVRDGKGQRDRLALLSDKALLCLRTYWRLFRLHSDVKSDYLFAPRPAKGRTNEKFSHTALGYVFSKAQKVAGIKKKSRLMSCATLLPSI